MPNRPMPNAEPKTEGGTCHALTRYGTTKEIPAKSKPANSMAANTKPINFTANQPIVCSSTMALTSMI